MSNLEKYTLYSLLYYATWTYLYIHILNNNIYQLITEIFALNHPKIVSNRFVDSVNETNLGWL